MLWVKHRRIDPHTHTRAAQAARLAHDEELRNSAVMSLWRKKPTGGAHQRAGVERFDARNRPTTPPGGKQHTKSAKSSRKKTRRSSGSGTGPGATTGPLQDRRRRLVSAREATLRDLGGLMLEMYKRNRFREELLLDKCEEVLAIEVEIAHVDQRLFQLAPATASGQRPIGRCECSAPILPGQNFCAVCGRAFATLTQPRTCGTCGSGLRTADAFCATCGSAAPDMLAPADLPIATIDAPSSETDPSDTMVSQPGVTPHDQAAPITVTTESSATETAPEAADTPELNFTIRTEPTQPPTIDPMDAAIDVAIAVSQAPSVEDSDQLDTKTSKRIGREKRRQVKQMARAKARAKTRKARARQESERRRKDGERE